MLKVPAPFPHAGASAYVSPYGEAVRIIQRNADGSFLIARDRQPGTYGSASDTFRAEASEVHATIEAAIGRKPGRQQTRRRRAA